MKLEDHIIPYTENQLKMHESHKNPSENIGENLLYIGLCNYIFDLTPKL